MKATVSHQSKHHDTITITTVIKTNYVGICVIILFQSVSFEPI